MYKRNPNTNKLDVEVVRIPAVHAITDWTVSEKIDGMNIRVIYTLDGYQVKGRSDNAQIPNDLIQNIGTLFPPHESVVQYFRDYRGKDLPDSWSVTFYGEGYGPGIQAKGKEYSTKKGFRCFDLLLGEGLWVDDSEMRRVCADLDIPVAPFLGIWSWDSSQPLFSNVLPYSYASLEEILPFSYVALEDRGVRDVEAEGIVAKPLVQLFDTRGERVVWKLTFREFSRVSPAHDAPQGASAAGNAHEAGGLTPPTPAG